MPKNPDIKKVLVLGSGPIVIGDVYKRQFQVKGTSHGQTGEIGTLQGFRHYIRIKTAGIKGSRGKADAVDGNAVSFLDAVSYTHLKYMQQARFLSQLYNSVPCGIIQFERGEGHRIVNVNRMGWELYGYGSEEPYP